MNTLFRQSAAAFLGLAILMGSSLTGDAQQKTKEPGKKKVTKETKSEEIIIQKNGDKKEKTTIVINGDEITVNGKPLSEYKDDDLVIRRRDSDNEFEWEGPGGSGVFTIPSPRVFASPRALTIPRNNWNFNWNNDELENESGPLLGVYTKDDDKGARITELMKDSPAEKAGLKKDDIIFKIGDKKVDGPESLADIINDSKPNDEVSIGYLRDGKEQSVKVKLGEKKGNRFEYFNLRTPRIERNFDLATPGNDFENFGMLSRGPRLGARIQETENGTGVKVLEVTEDSPAEKSGIKKDDVITEIDGNAVKNADDAREQISKTRDKASYNVKLLRNGSPMTIEVKIPRKLKTTNL
jgi:serine protease Do